MSQVTLLEDVPRAQVFSGKKLRIVDSNDGKAVSKTVLGDFEVLNTTTGQVLASFTALRKAREYIGRRYDEAGPSVGSARKEERRMRDAALRMKSKGK